MCTSSPKCCSTSVYSQWCVHSVKNTGTSGWAQSFLVAEPQGQRRAGIMHGSAAADREWGWTICTHFWTGLGRRQWCLTETQLLPKYYSIIQKSERKGSKEAADFHAPVKKKPLLHKRSSSAEQAPTWLHQYKFSAVGSFKNYQPNIILLCFSIIPKCSIKPSCRFGEFLLLYEHCCACFECILSVWFVFVVDASLTVTFTLK